MEKIDQSLTLILDNHCYGGVNRYVDQIISVLDGHSNIETINLNDRKLFFNFSLKKNSRINLIIKFFEFILNIPVALFFSLKFLNKKGKLLFVNGGYPGSFFLLKVFLFAGIWNLKPSLLILSVPKLREQQKIPNIIKKVINSLVNYFSYRLIVNCDKAKKELVEHLGFSNKKIIVAKGFSFLKFETPILKKGIKILYFARIEKEKGVLDFLELYLKITAKGYDSNIQWLIAGDGTEKSSLKPFEDKKNLRILGFIPDNEIPKLLKDATILILPSYAEGLPYSLLEGASAGCALVAYDVGGVSEVLQNGYNGFLIKKGDIQDLGEKVELLINSPDLLDNMIKNSLLLSEKSFSKKLFKESFLELLNGN